jgi:pimeloyl-ACP methyl ester carboxylesterase
MKNQPHLLILHGALGNTTMFKALAAEFEKDYCVHLLDLPFHAHQENLDEVSNKFNIGYFSEYLRNYLVVNNINEARVFAYSMGGYVALNALQHGEIRIASLITLATKLDWNPEQATKEAAMLNPDKLLEKVPAYAQQLAKRFGEQNWKSICSLTAALMLQLGNNPLLKNEQLRSIKTNVLMMIGDADKMVSLDETNAVRLQIPDARLAVLPQTQHPFEKVNLSLLTFLCRLHFSDYGSI